MSSKHRLTPTQRFFLRQMETWGRIKKGPNYKSTQTIRLLSERGLAQVSWWGTYWEATITKKGREALG